MRYLKHMVPKVVRANSQMSLGLLVVCAIMFIVKVHMDIHLEDMQFKRIKGQINQTGNQGREDLETNKDQKFAPETDLNIIAKETMKKLAPEFLEAGSSDKYINLLEVKPPEYLPNYKNPCWLETIDSIKPYNQNQFRDNDRYSSTFDELESLWESKLKNGQNLRLRCLPYFYIAGMPKCGTTELFARLCLHPDITRGPVKETHYWAKLRVGWLPNVGYLPIRSYVDLFDMAANDIQEKVVKKDGQDYHPMVFGDGSVTNLYENDWFDRLPENSADNTKPTWIVPHYLHHIYKQTRIIAILRDPVDRLYSDYLFYKFPTEKTPQSFHQFAIQSIRLMRECIDEHSLEQCIYNYSLKESMMLHLRDGFYATFVRSYLEIFGKDQVMILRLEDYRKSRIQTLNDVLAFLKLGEMSEQEVDIIEETSPRNHRSESMTKLGPMLDQTRKLLRDFYQPFNNDLAQLMDDKRYLWNDL